jgi:hypothetical protein
MDFNPQQGDNLVCSCGNEIGTLVKVRDLLWLNIGGVELRYAHGRCSNCLKIWHFNSNEIRLQLLIKHAIINQTNISG